MSGSFSTAAAEAVLTSHYAAPLRSLLQTPIPVSNSTELATRIGAVWAETNVELEKLVGDGRD